MERKRFYAQKNDKNINLCLSILYLCQKLGVQGIQEDFIDFYFEMQIGCINVIYLCQRIEIFNKK